MSDSLFTAVSRRETVRHVADRWREQYGDEPSDPRWREVLTKLDALDLDTVEASEIDAIIGNDSWTHETCAVCQSDAGEEWIEFQAWDEAHVMCRECVEKAAAVLRVKG